jgi:NitT/TauT family transport system substrate-binding protein
MHVARTGVSPLDNKNGDYAVTRLRRRCSAMLLIFGALAAVAGCGSSGSHSSNATGSTTTIKIGIAAPSIQLLSYYVAKDEGYFADEDLNLQETSIPTNGLVAALVGNDLNLGTTGSDTAVVAAAAGQSIPILFMLQQRNTQQLVIGKKLSSLNIPATYPANIRALPQGITIGLAALGGGSDVYDTAIMQGAGRTEGSGYKVLALGSVPNILAALRTGKVDAAMLFPPYASEAVQQGLGRIVDEESEHQAPAYFDRYGAAVLASPAWAKENPSVVAKLITALNRADNFIADPANTNRLLAIVAKETGVAESLNKPDLPTIVQLAKPQITCSRLEAMAKVYEQIGITKTVPSCSDMALTAALNATGSGA